MVDNLNAFLVIWRQHISKFSPSMVDNLSAFLAISGQVIKKYLENAWNFAHPDTWNLFLIHIERDYQWSMYFLQFLPHYYQNLFYVSPIFFSFFFLFFHKFFIFFIFFHKNCVIYNFSLDMSRLQFKTCWKYHFQVFRRYKNQKSRKRSLGAL